MLHDMAERSNSALPNAPDVAAPVKQRTISEGSAAAIRSKCILSALRPLRLVVDGSWPDGDDGRATLDLVGIARSGWHFANGRPSDAVAIYGSDKSGPNGILSIVYGLFDLLASGRSELLEGWTSLRSAQLEFVSSWRAGGRSGHDRFVIWWGTSAPMGAWDENDLDNLDLGTGWFGVGFERSETGTPSPARSTNRIGWAVHRAAMRARRHLDKPGLDPVDFEGGRKWGRFTPCGPACLGVVRLGDSPRVKRVPPNSSASGSGSRPPPPISSEEHARSATDFRQLLVYAMQRSGRSSGCILGSIDTAMGGRLAELAQRRGIALKENTAFATSSAILEANMSKGMRNAIALHLRLIIHRGRTLVFLIDIAAMKMDQDLETRTVQYIFEVVGRNCGPFFMLGMRSPAAISAWHGEHKTPRFSKSGIRLSRRGGPTTWRIAPADLEIPDDGYGDRIRIAVEGEYDLRFYGRIVGSDLADRIVFVLPEREYQQERLSRSVGQGSVGVRDYVNLRRSQSGAPHLFHGICDGDTLAVEGAIDKLLASKSALTAMPGINNEGIWFIQSYELENLLILHGLGNIYRFRKIPTKIFEEIIEEAAASHKMLFDCHPWSDHRDFMHCRLSHPRPKMPGANPFQHFTDILRLCQGKEVLRNIFTANLKKDLGYRDYEDFKEALIVVAADSQYGKSIQASIRGLHIAS